MNRELPDVQAGSRKGREPEIKLPTSVGSSRKQESSKKTSISALLTMAKHFTVWIIINCGKFWKRWEYQTTWPVSWQICMQIRKQRLELDMEQQTASKLGKKYVNVVYFHPAYLTYMQSTSCEMREAQLESRLSGEISITYIRRWHHCFGRTWRRTKEPLDESERGEWKSWLKTPLSENLDHGIWSHYLMANK